MVSGEAVQHLIMDVVLQFLDEEQWIFQKLDPKPVIRTGYHGEHGTWVGYIHIDEERQQFLFHALMGLNIPQQYRAAVVEFLTRVNYTLVTGNFEMNMDTGEVRFRVGLEAPNDGVSLSLVRSLIYSAIHSMDRYFPGVLAVVHGGLSPEAALARVETHAVVT